MKNSPERTDTDAYAPVVTHLLRALWREVRDDHARIIAAGLAYYAVFGLLPAVAAAAALWGVVGDTGALRATLQDTGGVVPPAIVDLLQPFLTSVPRGFGGGLALALNLLLVVWTAFRAAGALLTALNVVYDVEETRGRLRRSLVALAVGVAGILALFTAAALLAAAPLAAGWLRGGIALPWLWLRWPGLVVLFAAMLALLFRLGPNRGASPAGPLCWGVLGATGLVLMASAGISLYVANLANFGRLYGSLGSFAVALLWLYACALAVLVGAEIDASLTSRGGGTVRSPRDRR